MVSFPVLADGLPESVLWWRKTPCPVRWGLFTRPGGEQVVVGFEPLEGRSGVLHVDSERIAREMFAACDAVKWLGCKVAAVTQPEFKYPKVDLVDADGKPAGVFTCDLPTVAGGHAPDELVDGLELELVKESEISP